MSCELPGNHETIRAIFKRVPKRLSKRNAATGGGVKANGSKRMVDLDQLAHSRSEQASFSLSFESRVEKVPKEKLKVDRHGQREEEYWPWETIVQQ